MYSQQMETFIVVAESGSYAKASEFFGRSETYLKKQVSELEGQLGLALIETRKYGRVEMTDVGKYIYSEAHHFRSEFDRVLTKARLVQSVVKS